MTDIDDFASRLVDALGLEDGDLESTRTASVEGHPFLNLAVSAVFGSVATPSALSTNVRLLRSGGQQVPREHWSSSRVGEGQVIHTSLDTPLLDAAVVDGGVLAIDSVDESTVSMMRLREALEYLLSARVWVNVYLTSTATSTFGPHTDTQHTIIVQLFGRKRWVVSDRPRTAPDDILAGASTIDLKPGGALLVPAGTGHRVSGLAELTLHLTIGFDPLAWLPQQLRTTEALFGRESPELSHDELTLGKAMLRERRAGTSLPFRATRRPADCGHVRWASRLPPRIISTADGGLEVTSLGRRLSFSAYHAHLVWMLASGAEFSFDDLVRSGDIAPDALVAFLVDALKSDVVICRV